MKRLFTTVALLFVMGTGIAQIPTPPFVNPYPKTISVTGTAEMEILPDEIFVQINLREYEKKGSGKVNIETIKKHFLKICKEAGIPDSFISVASYQGADRLYWLNKKKKNPDMMASVSYMIRFSNIQKIDAMVEQLDDEATQGFYIAKTGHSKIDLLKQQLKIQAVKDARKKAEELAGAIGETVGVAISIQEPMEHAVYPVYKNMAPAGVMLRNAPSETGDDPGSNIDFTKMKLKFDIQTVFALQ